jgi:methyl-accepting chemotaxis protein
VPLNTVRNRRSNSILVEKDFQFRFTVKICLINGVIFFVAGGLFLYFVRLNYEMLIQDALIQMPDMVESLRREYRLTSLWMMMSIVVMLAVTFVSGLSMTSRISGPLYALRRKLREYSEGQQGIRLALRSRDEFHNLEEVFNVAMESSDSRKRDLAEELQKILQLLKGSENIKAKTALEELVDRHPKPKIFY